MESMEAMKPGLLMYRERVGGIEVFLVHPGGPIWAKRDQGAWTIPTGEYDTDEDPLAAARREFHEETGFVATEPFIALGSIRQKGGKVVIAWAFAGDCDSADLTNDTCEIEWPPRSGKRMEISEVDRGSWFSFENARKYVLAQQVPFLDSLESWSSRT
jgi:predicted NUDIX family NTP pyrophosphohydrolase